jgi:hypothetical protein
MEEKKKSNEEYVKEFKELHKKFVNGEGGFIGEDYVPLRKKKIKKAKVKRKCKK